MSFVPPLASIAAVRPVFMIVMGVFLMMTAWRLAKSSSGWAKRLIIIGSLLLGLGYTVVMPLYEAGKIPRLQPASRIPGSHAGPIAAHVVKVIAMNGGWLFFGLGMALHAQLFSPSPCRRAAPSNPKSHEFVA